MIHFDLNNYFFKSNAYRMSRLIPVLILSLFSFNLGAQCLPAPAVPQTEGFNTAGTTTFPTCWTSAVVTNNGGSTPAVTFVTSGTNATSSPQEGTRMIKFNSYNCYSGGQVRLMSLPVNTVSVSSVDVEFYWLNDNTNYTSYLDNVQVQYSLNGTTWTNVGTPFNRPDGGSGAVWNQKTVTLPAGAAGQTTLYVGFLFTSDYGNNCYFDKVTIKATPSCGTPTGLAANATSATTASLSWTAPGVGTPIGYEYVVSTASTTPVGSGTLVAGTSASPTGLTANTTYYAFVRTKCGASSFSGWTLAASFTTPCNAVAIPQTEGFNGGVLPTCWSTTLLNAGSFTTAALTFPTTGSNPNTSAPEGTNMVMFNSWSTSGGIIRLNSLPVSTLGVSSVDVAFKWLNDNSNYTASYDNVQVQYSLDGSTWTNAGSAFNRPDGGTGTTWNTKTVTLPAAAGNKSLLFVGFQFSSQYGNNCYFDSVVIKSSPTCFVPASITATPTSSTAATIAWSAPGGGTAPSNYQYTIATNSTPPSGSGTIVGGTSTPVTGLAPNTTYYVYVRSFCGGTDYSSWAGPISFTTPCTAATLPYVEPFSSSLTTCWLASSSGSANWVTGTSDATHGVSGPQAGTYFAYLDVYNAVTGGNPYYLKTSPVSLPCNTSLSYYYFLGSSGPGAPLDVEITTNYGASWTTLYSHTSSNSTFSNSSSTAGWYQNVISLNTYNGQTIMLRFKGTSNYGVGVCNMAIDELDILPKTPTATNSVQCGTVTPTCAVASTTGVAVPSFRWYTVATGGTAISGQTGAALSGYPVAATTTFYVSEMVGSAESRRVAVTATVNPLPVVTTNVTNVTCYGGNNGAATANVTSGTPTFGYSWNTSPVQTTASISGLVANTYTVTVTDSKGCIGTANAIVTQPGISSLPAISSQPSNRVICSGTNTTFATTATGLGITYQWYVNTGSGFVAVTNTGVYTGAQTATLTITGAPVGMNGYTYRCIATGTCTPAATTNTVSLTVNETIPSVSIGASATTMCAGTNVTFTPTPTNGGTTPFYQWKKNGINTATGSSYSTTTLANGDVITCVMTSNATCPNPASVTSNAVAMTVNPIVTPTITINSSQGTTMCFGTSVTFSATITNGGSNPQYQWKKNGINIATGSTYNTSAINNGDVITCVLTSNAICTSTSTANSNSLTMSIVPLVVPSVSIAATDDHICIGSSTTFTATPTNGGNTPTYIWKNAGVTIPGATGNTYTSSGLLNGNVITSVMTTSVGCYTTPTATSNGVTMTVDPILVPSVSIVASTDTIICAGTNVTFLALPTNGGNAPDYQWRLNGNPMTGATVSMYGLSILNTGDVITCDLMSSYMCPSTSVTGSNSLKFTVNPTAPPVVGIASNKGNIIQPNETVTFTSTVLNVGPAPTYIWKKNGTVITGVTGKTYTTADIVNNDQISLVVISDIECSNPDSGTSNSITMMLNTGVRNVGHQLTEVNLYPNPNSGYFTIEADVQGISGINKATYELLNNLGQMVSKGDVEVKNGMLKQDVRMNDVANGTYFIRINFGSNSVVKKFNVQ
jgi:hypothetical protein